MMDYGGILRRAWRITWDHKYLWWLGFLTALGSGGGGGGNVSNSFDRSNLGQRGDVVPPGFTSPELGPGIWGLVAALVCVFLLIALAVWVVSTIARGGLISAANHIEDGERSSFREGWQAGRARMWPMLGIGLIQAVPGIVIALALAIYLVAILGLSSLPTVAEDPMALLARAGPVLVCIIPLFCILALVSLALQILRPFADRACVMEGHPVVASYQRGWEVLRTNFGDSLVLGIIRFFIGLVIGIIVALPFIVLGLGAVAGFVLSGGADFQPQPGTILPILVAAGCFFLVFVLIGALVGAVLTTFFSSMWTLAYRQFVGSQPKADAPPAEAPAAA